MFYVSKKRRGPQMLIAPLIDCVFLLLIFFMSTTVFPDNAGIKVEKPEAETGKPLTTEHMLIAISKDGEYYYKGNVRSIEEIREIIKAEVAVRPEREIIVQVDRNTVTDHLIRILDVARIAKARNIAIATKQIEEK
jgi:biopolymer transport protein ExbD